MLPGLRRLAILALVAALSPAAAAQSVATRHEALAAVYPGAQIQEERVFLTEAQQKAAAALAGVEVPSALIARYVARRDGKLVGRAYIDTHVVRTKKESLLIALDAGGAVARVEVTAFLEPPEYHASQGWVAQYRGRMLTDDLNLQRAIRPIAGATLTARAINDAVRRVLAIDRVLAQAAAREAK